MARISQVKLSNDNNQYLIEPTLHTSARYENNIYIANLQNFDVAENVFIQVTFSSPNGAGAKLNVNGTGAKDILYRGGILAQGIIQDGSTHTLFYDGTNWIIVGDIKTNGTGLDLENNIFSVKYGTAAGTAAAGNDSRLSDARTPKSHKHGNIENDGTLGTTASRAVVTDGNKKITVADLTFADPSASTTDTSLSFIDTISQDSQGKISATKKSLPKVSATSDGIVPKGEAVTGAQTQSTKFLRSDGTWALPEYTVNTDMAVKQNENRDNKEFSILLKTSDNLTSERGQVKFAANEGKAVTVNPNTGRITAPGGVSGIKWEDLSGTPSVSIVGHKHVWNDITSPPTTLSGYGISDAYINAGTIKLGENTISPVTTVTWDETNKKFTQTINGTAADIVNAASLVSGMGLSNALHFIGITSTALEDGSTTAELTANSTNSLSKTTGFIDGDVVMDKDQMREYVWSGSAWHLLGITTSAAQIYPQTVVGNTWISQITQGTDGRITATTGGLITTGTWEGNAVTATTATNLANAPQILKDGTSVNSALEASTNYTLSIGGKTVNFTTPTDENNKVSQSASASRKWRKVMLGYEQYDDYNTDIGNTITDVIYGAADVAIQPYTGTLRAITVQGGNMQLTGDTLSFVGTGATKALITGLNGNANGHGIKIGGGAVTVIGAGESASSFSPTATSEILYLLSDKQIYLEAGGDAIANRVGFEITSANEVIPVKAEKDTNNYGSIGTNSYKWANIYATTIHGELDGNAATATSATNATNDSDENPINTTYLKLTGGTMTGNINMETPTAGDTTADDGTGTIILANSGTKIIQKMRDTSNWGTALAWDTATHLTNTYLPGIGYHNTGHTISIVPEATNTSPWNRTVGLSVGNENMKFYGALVAVADDAYTEPSESVPVYLTSTGTLKKITSYSGTAAIANKLGTADLGGTTTPIYLKGGVATECDTYAGGTAVTLNGSDKAKSTASFYAPTAGGATGTILVGKGTTTAPGWADAITIGSNKTGSIWCGTWKASTAGTGTRQIGVANGSGKLYLQAAAAVTGEKGLYATKTDGTEEEILIVNQSNQISDLAIISASPTITGTVYINNSTDATGTGNTGSLVIGDKSDENIAIDDNEIMARKNKTASVLHINNQGGQVTINSGVTAANQTDSSSTTTGALVVTGGVGVTKTVYAAAFNGPLTGNVTGDVSGSSGSCTGNAATATKLKNAVNLWGNSFDGSSSISGDIELLGQLNLNRKEDATYGRINYYKNTYHTWYTYMSSYTNATAPTGGKPSQLGNVTSWAMRSIIEHSSGYGWIWEACKEEAAGSSTVEPTARMALSSHTGQLRIAPNASLITNETAGLIIDGAKNASSGNVAIELWRGTQASWQIANESGDLYFRNNYTNKRQNTYTQTSVKIEYNTGDTTLSGALSARSLTTTNTGPLQIYMTRTDGPNWIQAPTDGSIAFCVNDSLSGTNGTFKIDGTSVNGYNNEKTDLGTSTIQWKNVYAKSYTVDNAVTLQYNTTDESLDFVFA